MLPFRTVLKIVSNARVDRPRPSMLRKSQLVVSEQEVRAAESLLLSLGVGLQGSAPRVRLITSDTGGTGQCYLLVGLTEAEWHRLRNSSTSAFHSSHWYLEYNLLDPDALAHRDTYQGVHLALSGGEKRRADAAPPSVSDRTDSVCMHD